jgi:hypothetical protein
MLPHLVGKFDVECFIRTGAVIDHSTEPMPDTEAMRHAKAEWERDQEIIAQRMRERNGW